MARRKNIVIEDMTPKMLNDERDAQRRVLNRMEQPAMQELQKRGVEGATGTYNDSFFSEVDKRALALRMGNTAPHAHLVEYGTGPRATQDGQNRGSMPQKGRRRGIIRKAALALRRKVFDEMTKELSNV